MKHKEQFIFPSLLIGMIWCKDIFLWSSGGKESIAGVIGGTLVIFISGGVVGIVAGLFLIPLPTNVFLIVVSLLASTFLIVKWIQYGRVVLLKNSDTRRYAVKVYWGELDLDYTIEGRAVSYYDDPSKIEVKDVGSVKVKNGRVYFIEGGNLSKM